MHHMPVARLGLSWHRQAGDAPFDQRGIHRFHFLIVTIVPVFASDTRLKSPIRRFTPCKPRPKPPDVEKPSCITREMLAIPGPLSRANTVMPTRLPVCTDAIKISPRLA